MQSLRILYITPWSPSLTTGGGRHCYANLRSLCSFPGARIDFVGPGIDHSLPGIERERFITVAARPYTPFDKMTAALHGEASSLAGLFKQFAKKHSLNVYDLLFVESTLCGFLFEGQRMRAKTVFVVHNVEADYFRMNSRGITRLAAKNIDRSEEITLRASDSILVMHDDDRQRLRELYGMGNANRVTLHPVCSFPPKFPPLPFEEREQAMVFVGSLDLPFNEKAVKDFIARCWPGLKDVGYTLKIAGRNPSRELAGLLAGQKHVELIPNPADMEPLMRRARMLIVPDMSGTGMKLRVAEALSYGVPVVGTEHGLRGYQNIPQFGVAVKDIGQMTAVIKDLISGHENSLSLMASNAYTVWQEQYSYDVFSKRLHKIIRES